MLNGAMSKPWLQKHPCLHLWASCLKTNQYQSLFSVKDLSPRTRSYHTEINLTTDWWQQQQSHNLELLQNSFIYSTPPPPPFTGVLILQNQVTIIILTNWICYIDTFRGNTTDCTVVTVLSIILYTKVPYDKILYTPMSFNSYFESLAVQFP